MARINFVEKTVNKKCHHFLGGMTIYNWYYHFQIDRKGGEGILTGLSFDIITIIIFDNKINHPGKRQ